MSHSSRLPTQLSDLTAQFRSVSVLSPDASGLNETALVVGLTQILGIEGRVGWAPTILVGYSEILVPQHFSLHPTFL